MIGSIGGTMYTKNDLIEDLKKMGLSGTEAIMVHSSMKSIGKVEGGADTVVDAFMEFFKEGLFMTPTHTWAQMSSEYSVFDPETEPACVGIIPNVFRKKEGVLRSLHPTHSIAIYGKGAEEYIQGEENATTPCPPGGCWDRLTKEPTLMHIKMPDGSLKDVQMYRHYNSTLGTGSFSDHFDKMMQAFYDLGAAKQVKFGDADCILCDAKGIFEVCSKLFAIEENCVIDREEIPEEWWKG